MTVKDIAKNLINSLPSNATIDDVIHALYVHAKFQHGEQEIKQGKGISKEDAQKRLRRLPRNNLRSLPHYVSYY